MEAKSVYLIGIFLAVVIVSGCIGETVPEATEPTGGQCLQPKIIIGGICCYDANDNGVCDMDDAGCPDTCDDGNPCTDDMCSGATDFKCVNNLTYPCCGNGVCDPSEDVENVCSEDCTVLKLTKFKYSETPDYMDGEKFVFIHTGSSETEERFFYLNITAGLHGMENIKYTFKCNSTQHSNLDSIDSELYNVSDDVDEKINKLEDSHYLIYTNFYEKKTGVFGRDISALAYDEMASFHFNIEKKNPQQRDDLTCLFKFYFSEPQKIVHKWLEISYI